MKRLCRICYVATANLYLFDAPSREYKSNIERIEPLSDGTYLIILNYGPDHDYATDQHLKLLAEPRPSRMIDRSGGIDEKFYRANEGIT